MKGGRSIRSFDPDDMPFQVVAWDTANDRPFRVLAASVSVTLAASAYFSALPDHGSNGRRVMLMHGARVLRDSDR